MYGGRDGRESSRGARALKSRSKFCRCGKGSALGSGMEGLGRPGGRAGFWRAGGTVGLRGGGGGTVPVKVLESRARGPWGIGWGLGNGMDGDEAFIYGGNLERGTEAHSSVVMRKKHRSDTYFPKLSTSSRNEFYETEEDDDAHMGDMVNEGLKHAYRDET
jgi:hypothetical protein